MVSPMPRPSSFVVTNGSKMRSMTSAGMPAPASRTVTRAVRPDPVTLENGTMANDGWLRFLAALARLDLRLHELAVAVEGPPNKPKRPFEKRTDGNGSG